MKPIAYQEFEEHWNRMDASRRAGFLVWPSLTGPQLSEAESRLLDQYGPWGVSLFGRNLKEASQARELTDAVRQRLQGARPAGWPMGFIAIDEEGGRVSRLPPPFPKLLSAAAVAQQGLEAVASQARHQAEAARALGINMFFAPVCDVLVEPTNQVIGDRAFGSDPVTVYTAARVAYGALRSAGILPVIKHFPGHGATQADTHQRAAEVKAPLEVLRRRELAVFRNFFENERPPAVMTCHVSLESVDPGVPATLSRRVIDGILRTEMGYSGLVMSDDLRMNAIANFLAVNKEQEVAIGSDELARLEGSHRSLEGARGTEDAYLVRAARAALEAGCDVVLACRGIEREACVLEGIAAELQNDVEFAAQCLPKAWRVWTLASAGS